MQLLYTLPSCLLSKFWRGLLRNILADSCLFIVFFKVVYGSFIRAIASNNKLSEVFAFSSAFLKILLTVSPFLLLQVTLCCPV